MSQLRMFIEYVNARVLRTVLGLAAPLLLVYGTAQGASIPKWDRFEQSFESSASYANPPQEAGLRVVFVSPSGENKRTYGFWDGGNTWRVRFAPDQEGKWTFKTICSDEKNKGLHSQSGEFTCT